MVLGLIMSKSNQSVQGFLTFTVTAFQISDEIPIATCEPYEIAT